MKNLETLNMKKFRKLLIKKWLPPEMHKHSGRWSDDFEVEAIFHTWGSSYEEFESGAVSYATAIVELLDGTVQNIEVSKIKFLDKPT